MQWNETSQCEFDGKLMETEKQHDQNLPIVGTFIVEQMLASEERNKSNPIWDLSSKVNHLSKFMWDDLVEIITEFTRSILSARIGTPALMMDDKSPAKTLGR